MDEYLSVAIQEARKGLDEGGVPIGAVLVHRDRILAKGRNRRCQQSSVIRHAEMDTLENAGRQAPSVYKECTMYTTLSPCTMCCGAILLYGIPRLVIGENETFTGDEDLLRQRGVSIDVLQISDCIDLMKQFKKASPEVWNEDIGV